MKISNKIIMAAMWLMHYLNPPAKDVDEIFAHAKKHNQKRHFRLPKSRRTDYKVKKIQTGKGSYPCLRMKRKNSKTDRAVLYICGGGGVYDYCRAQLFLAKKLLKRVEAEIYYPFYPPSTVCSIRETHAMIFESYRAMLDEYPPERIGVVGLSFGGTAAMTMISWNNSYKKALPMPALTIALSPGHVPANPAEREILVRYRGLDPFVPVEWVEAFGYINKGGEDLEHWLTHTAHGDFTNAGKILLYFAETESLAYASSIYEESLKRAGADYRIHLEPDMPHCYGIARINKASKKTYDEITALLNGL